MKLVIEIHLMTSQTVQLTEIYIGITHNALTWF